MDLVRATCLHDRQLNSPIFTTVRRYVSPLTTFYLFCSREALDSSHSDSPLVLDPAKYVRTLRMFHQSAIS